MNFEIHPGITVIIGHTGAGKTTLLRRFSGLDGKTSFRAVGYVMQTPYLFPYLSVYENVVFGYKRLAPEKRKVTAEEVIDHLNIQHLFSRKFFQLSGGEQQQIAIARSLLMSPEILLMDEPVSALDMRNKAKMLTALLYFREKMNIPMLYVTHNEAEVTRLAGHVVVLKNRTLYLQGSLDALFLDPLFLEETQFLPPSK